MLLLLTSVACTRTTPLRFVQIGANDGGARQPLHRDDSPDAVRSPPQSTTLPAPRRRLLSSHAARRSGRRGVQIKRGDSVADELKAATLDRRMDTFARVRGRYRANLTHWGGEDPIFRFVLRHWWTGVLVEP
eukprot:gene38723-50439_t